MSKWLAPLTTLLILVLGSEILVQLDFIPASLYPPPSEVFKVLGELRPDFLTAFQETLTNVLLGLSLSIVIGGGLAASFSLSRVLQNAIYPFAVFFQTMPIIAIAPLLVIYFGFGSPTVIAASFIVSVFPVVANTLTGLQNVPKDLLDLFKISQASPWEEFKSLRLPSAYVSILSGLKISAGLAIIGAISGEFVAGGGLGAMIDSARTQQRVDIVFCALFLLSLMGLTLMGLLSLINFQLNRYRPFAISGRK